MVLPPKPSQSGDDGATGAGAGFDAGFFFFFASVAFVIPFFLRAGVPRFAFLDFFATFQPPHRFLILAAYRLITLRVTKESESFRILEIVMYCANFPSNVMADTARNRQSGSVADRRRALTVLGDNPDGCTQAILLAHGFKSQLLAELVRTKLVTEHYERVMQGGRPINVTRMRITAAGRLALKPLR